MPLGQLGRNRTEHRVSLGTAIMSIRYSTLTLVALFACSASISQGAVDLGLFNLNQFGHGQIIQGTGFGTELGAGSGIFATGDGGTNYNGVGLITFDSLLAKTGPDTPDEDLFLEETDTFPFNNLLTVQEDGAGDDDNQTVPGFVDTPNDEIGFSVTMTFGDPGVPGDSISLFQFGNLYDLLVVDLNGGGAMEAVFTTENDETRTFSFPNLYTQDSNPNNFAKIDLVTPFIPVGPGANGDDADSEDSDNFSVFDDLETAVFTFSGSGAFSFSLNPDPQGNPEVPEAGSFLVWSVLTATTLAWTGRRRSARQEEA